MDHPSNILDNIKPLFTWKRVRYFLFNILFIVVKRLTSHSSLSRCKKLHITSKSPNGDFSLSHGDLIADLELRRIHSFFYEIPF